MTLEFIEEKFHKSDFYFGDTMDFEIEKMIPTLKKKYQDQDDFIIYLNKKLMTLSNFKKGIEMKVE